MSTPRMNSTSTSTGLARPRTGNASAHAMKLKRVQPNSFSRVSATPSKSMAMTGPNVEQRGDRYMNKSA
jgi:hypothetical protein